MKDLILTSATLVQALGGLWMLSACMTAPRPEPELPACRAKVKTLEQELSACQTESALKDATPRDDLMMTPPTDSGE